MVPTSKAWILTSGICGILCPAVAIAGIGIAISYAPWFNWTQNGLSDLSGVAGEIPVWAARGTASIIFNIGLVLYGILAFLFALGLVKIPLLTGGIGRIGILIFMAGSSTLFAMGILPRSLGTLHEAFSVLFFVLLPVSALLLGVGLLNTRDRLLGILALALGIIGLSPLFIPWPWSGEAIPDSISILAMMVFMVAFSLRLLAWVLPHENTMDDR